jgi:hypothetical protein
MAPVGLTWRKAHTVDPDSCHLDQSKGRLFRHHRGIRSGIDGEGGLCSRRVVENRLPDVRHSPSAETSTHWQRWEEPVRSNTSQSFISRAMPWFACQKCAGPKQKTYLKSCRVMLSGTGTAQQSQPQRFGTLKPPYPYHRDTRMIPHIERDWL